MLAHGLVNSWASSIQYRDPMRMLAFYSDDAVLLATYSNLLRGKDEILDYFISFLNKEDLKCKITDIYTIPMDRYYSLASSGLYNFSFYDQGQFTKVKARYTYVVKDNEIVMHHSSVLPE